VKEQTWDQWLRVCIRDKSSPIELPPATPSPMAMLTGQDSRALSAIAACWKLYALSDDDGARAALDAVRALLAAMQPKCRPFARELIAFALDWGDRARLWPLVSGEVSP
jgi:hypothetical protein